MKTDSQGNIYMEQNEYQEYLASKEKPLEIWQMSTEEDNKPQEGEITTTTATPTLYELNQQIIEKMPVLTKDEINHCAGKILKYLDKNPDPYYMLLCNELNYYTLFHITSAKYNAGGNLMMSRGAMRDLTQEILSIISNLGNVRVIEEDNNEAIAIWSSFNPFNPIDYEENEDKTVHCFYLFPYGKGVVEV